MVLLLRVSPPLSLGPHMFSKGDTLTCALFGRSGPPRGEGINRTRKRTLRPAKNKNGCIAQDFPAFFSEQEMWCWGAGATSVLISLFFLCHSSCGSACDLPFPGQCWQAAQHRSTVSQLLPAAVRVSLARLLAQHPPQGALQNTLAEAHWREALQVRLLRLPLQPEGPAQEPHLRQAQCPAHHSDLWHASQCRAGHLIVCQVLVALTFYQWNGTIKWQEFLWFSELAFCASISMTAPAWDVLIHEIVSCFLHILSSIPFLCYYNYFWCIWCQKLAPINAILAKMNVNRLVK